MCFYDKEHIQRIACAFLKAYQMELKDMYLFEFPD